MVQACVQGEFLVQTELMNIEAREEYPLIQARSATLTPKPRTAQNDAVRTAMSGRRAQLPHPKSTRLSPISWRRLTSRPLPLPTRRPLREP